ncbi:hypothetical protein LTR99_006916 [Exophiala xenobiotica]|uniref:NAD(P)-binding domain-containing protein n=1 Tax=Vermiconidia calcicola TaxID=1690605 RepID=A0AAV9PY76_9PEZI|nr:hypothetical protein LTR92_006733 [Exophiala xenobiotica]KAK5531912.1 hypothetical protein LTR25_008242 [Vermiconidia calcicola]KAK5537260.1 hypothetical protein LTR23_007471 [Chaetothyriales sp. CCFEE 6169]KAK5221261.1 hypothetical protein LTR72_006821 [Exophiala xenobiotica]KAK5269482.1 hypothetical protein LTR96_005178 [Exophiala xenobiotica]
MLPQILLIGATGRTGSLVLSEALTRGHSVTILLRKPNSNLPQDHANLTTVTGDPCDASDVEKALRSCSSTRPNVPVVIISTLGQTRTSGNPWAATTSPARFMDTSAKAVLAAAAAAASSEAVKTKTGSTGSSSGSSRVQVHPIEIVKFVVMSMFGVGDSFANLNFALRWTFNHSNMDQTLEDQTLVDQTVRNGNLPYVLVRPVILNEGEAAPVKVYASSAEGVGFMPKISVKSVAKFLVDAASKGDWDGTAPVIVN